jgi:transcriptional regulator with XRE-family HTH domain
MTLQVEDAEVCALPFVIVPFYGLLTPGAAPTAATIGISWPSTCLDIEAVASAKLTTRAASDCLRFFSGTYASATETGDVYLRAPLASGDEVCRLRDEITRRSRLSQAQIARAIGVNRRSLALWVKGTNRPKPDRVERLRFLAALVRTIDASKPGRAKEELLAFRGPGDLLDEIAQGRYERAEAWQARVQPPVVRVERSQHAGGELHKPALRAFLEGKLQPLGRSHVLRSPDVYAQDLSKAERFMSGGSTPRRRGDP